MHLLKLEKFVLTLNNRVDWLHLPLICQSSIRVLNYLKFLNILSNQITLQLLKKIPDLKEKGSE